MRGKVENITVRVGELGTVHTLVLTETATTEIYTSTLIDALPIVASAHAPLCTTARYCVVVVRLVAVKVLVVLAIS
ncbi:hypothetical protein CSC81_17060, partial [Tenacibaculum discolor]